MKYTNHLIQKSPGKRRRATTSSLRQRYGRGDGRRPWSGVSSSLMIVSTVERLMTMIYAMVVTPSMKAEQDVNQGELIRWPTLIPMTKAYTHRVLRASTQISGIGCLSLKSASTSA